MNRFKNICDTCPLRTKVDVARASEMDDWKDPSICTLSDGVHSYEVRKPANDETCSSPENGLLRRKCGIGLATAWRLSEQIGQYTSNITNPNELILLLDAATYQDAMPHYTDGAWIFGDPPEYSELNRHDPAFENCTIKKLTQDVRGTRAALNQGKAVMLDKIRDIIVDDRLHGVFRIRVAQGGPHFAFRAYMPPSHDKDRQKYDENLMRIFAEGLHAYLFSDDAAIAESESLLNDAYEALEEQQLHMSIWLSGNG